MNVQDAASLTIPEGNVRNIHNKNNQLLWSAVGYDVKYKGDTTQQTYTGKNKMPIQSAALTDDRMKDFVIALPAGTYTYSFDLDSFEVGTNSSFSINSQLYLSTGTYKDNNISGSIDNNTSLGRKSYTFTLDTDAIIDLNHKSNIRIPLTLYNNGARASISNIMIEPGSTATDYEPYVGGSPAPNPDYPQDVNVVKGAQSIKITGKNLSQFTNASLIPSQAAQQGAITTITDNSVHFIAISDTASTQYAYYYTDEFDPSVQYTISGIAKKIAVVSHLRVVFSYSDDGSTWATNTAVFNAPSVTAGTAQNFSYTFTGHKYYRFGFYNSSGATTVGTETEYYNVQIESGSTATAYEPYQGQTFPVDLGSIELCKIGNYQDYIYKSGGKNLWGGYTQYDRSNNGITFSTLSDGSITAKGLASAQAYSVLGSQIIPNNVYITLGAGTYYLSTLEPVPTGVSVQIVNETGGNIKTDVGSFTLSAPTPLACRLSITSGTDISGGITVKPMIALGSTATPYEPYGTDWYVYKETGKVTFSGGASENWDRYVAGEVFRIRVLDMMGQDNQGVTAPLYCDYYTPNAYSVITSSGRPDYGIAARATAANGIAIRNKDCADVTAFKSWLGTHNTTVYYVLATPTYTKITDATMISQLNAVHDWLRRYDYYGVVSGNLPIIIDRTGII